MTTSPSAARSGLLLDDVTRLDIKGVDAVVLSACVQMPSLKRHPDGRGPPRASGDFGGDLHDRRMLVGAQA